jgi:hypothetical protein
MLGGAQPPLVLGEKSPILLIDFGDDTFSNMFKKDYRKTNEAERQYWAQTKTRGEKATYSARNHSECYPLANPDACSSVWRSSPFPLSAFNFLNWHRNASHFPVARVPEWKVEMERFREEVHRVIQRRSLPIDEKSSYHAISKGAHFCGKL